ncbi:MAG TPA: c-type cytochrome [Telluria sp.]|nr:c-type cytochrome [Telluria sp.]
MSAKMLRLTSLAALALLAACAGHHHDDDELDPVLVAKGKKIFRYDTFGDEAKWTGQLRMHEVIASSVSPAAALGLGLKVDLDALPPAVREGIRNGSIDLNSPDTTVALLKLDAVVGVVGKVEAVQGKNVLRSVGVTCALCHSTVDNAFSAGIGKRLDGWPNRDLNVGAVIALSPALTAAQRAVYTSWGKGRYDPRFNIDGKNGPVEIPPAYGLRGIHRITYTGDGKDVTYWNRYVAVTQMGGLGHFADPRIGVDITNGDVDLVGPALPALRAYQLSLEAPHPPKGSFDKDAADRGRRLFKGKANCVSCHLGPKFTDANLRLHAPSEVVSEPEPNGAPSYASRSATKLYRTSPLRGVWQHPPYFHNGKAATLQEVVEVYNQRQALGLTPAEVADLAEYLKSL